MPPLKRTLSTAAYSTASKRSKKTAGGSAYKLDQRIKQLINRAAETKYWDEALATATPIPTSGNTVLVNDVTLGNDYNNRIGRHVNPKYSVCDFLIKGPSNMVMDTGFVALVWDKQPNAGTAGFSTIFDTSVSPIGLNFKQVATSKDRFVILWQEDWVTQTSTNGNFEGIRMKKFYDLSRHKFLQEFAGSGTTIQSGALLLCYVSNNNTGTSDNSASIIFNHRYAFTDE